MKVLGNQSCLTLCEPMDCSLLGYSIHGILQGRTLEWFDIPFSQRLNPGLLHGRQIRYRLSHRGMPIKETGEVLNVSGE